VYEQVWSTPPPVGHDLERPMKESAPSLGVSLEMSIVFVGPPSPPLSQCCVCLAAVIFGASQPSEARRLRVADRLVAAQLVCAMQVAESRRPRCT